MGVACFSTNMTNKMSEIMNDTLSVYNTVSMAAHDPLKFYYVPLECEMTQVNIQHKLIIFKGKFMETTKGKVAYFSGHNQ